jgi:hypothetical protein
MSAAGVAFCNQQVYPLLIDRGKAQIPITESSASATTCFLIFLEVKKELNNHADFYQGVDLWNDCLSEPWT